MNLERQSRLIYGAAMEPCRPRGKVQYSGRDPLNPPQLRHDGSQELKGKPSAHRLKEAFLQPRKEGLVSLTSCQLPPRASLCPTDVRAGQPPLYPVPTCASNVAPVSPEKAMTVQAPCSCTCTSYQTLKWKPRHVFPARPSRLATVLPRYPPVTLGPTTREPLQLGSVSHSFPAAA